MGCGASKTTAATEPRASTPTHGTYDAQIIDETPIQSLKHQTRNSINLFQPDDEIFIPNRTDPAEQNRQPDVEEQSTTNNSNQRRSSHVTSNDSGLEEDNGQITEPATRAETSHSNHPDVKSADEQPGILTPDNERSAVFIEDKAPENPNQERTHTGVSENDPHEQIYLNEPEIVPESSVLLGDESTIVLVNPSEQEILELGGSIQNEIETENNVNGNSAENDWNTDFDNSSSNLIKPNGEDPEQNTLLIAGTATETTEPSENEQRQEFEQKNKTPEPIARPATSKRPSSAQSRAHSAFKRPESSNSAKIAPMAPFIARQQTKPESRPASAKSEKATESVPNADVVQPKIQSRSGSAKSTKNITNFNSRPASKISNKSAQSLPIETLPENKLAEINSGRQSQQSVKSMIIHGDSGRNSPVVKKTSRPGSKNSQATFDVTRKSSANQFDDGRKTPQSISNSPRPSSKTSQAPKRPESAISQRSTGSLRVPEIETSNTNITNAERSASSLEDLEMLQHVMEGTLEPPKSDDVNNCEQVSSSTGADEPDGKPSTNENETSSNDPIATKENSYANDDDFVPETKLTLEAEPQDAKNNGNTGETTKSAENDSHPARMSKENTQSELEDVEKNNLLDTFSTKNLEQSMRPNSGGGNKNTLGEPDKTNEVINSPIRSPDEQEEHVNA
ncbi:uncharacterized protein LOC142341027 [Convolutriloba macropyga]|uniref:uncharacterized protein LOC142341027 n=1 Tax=Convolutriloba macropyga TaxID=536237 RepID=UPI003F526BFF